MRLYLSGPMTGCPDHNRPAFDAAAKRLREQGHFVINPHDFTPIFGTEKEVDIAFKIRYDPSYSDDISEIEDASRFYNLAEQVLQSDLAAVRSCDAIYMLKGWEQSRGAKKELAEAIAHGLTIIQDGAEG